MIRGIDDGMLFEAFQFLAGYPHVLPMVHAENIELVFRAMDRVRATGREDLAAWSEARPEIAEEEAQQRAWFFARRAKARLLIVHMSAGYTAEQLATQRADYPHFYGETCPQYLGLDYSMDLGPFGKCNPPVRGPKNRTALWDGLASGAIDFVGSDHAPWPRESKNGSLWEAGPGLPGMPSILPVLLSEGVNGGRLSMQQLVQVTSYNASKIFGLLPRKGVIAAGADADLTALDMSWKRTFTPEVVGSGVDWSPFEGLEYTGWPTMTVLRGQVAVDRGELVNDSMRGTRIRSNRMPAKRRD
jgi:dihydroorotase-like cyclic amidohydrolase